jgi:pimeloyl-ACP methyl ester carboxylesterase
MNITTKGLFCFTLLLLARQAVCAQTLKRIELDSNYFFSGHYHVVEPKSANISGVLLLLAGFGQRAEDTPPETKLHHVAFTNKILTVFFAAGNKLYADSITEKKLSAVLKDVVTRYKVKTDKFVLGGFSAGGTIALRYVELCNEFPDKFPIQPKGVFMVDSPIDFFTIWNELEELANSSSSEISIEEAVRAMKHIKDDHGDPKENFSYYANLNPFSMNKKHGENELFLKSTAVRVYHDVDISWWLKNRNQSVIQSNYLVTSELINRLLLMGNSKAEFMQSYQTGYRSNGERHPHSWSIIEEVEFMQWMNRLMK